MTIIKENVAQPKLTKNTDLIRRTLTKASFLISATQLSGCPEDSGAEIAFVGRSNAGKSSAINKLCNQNKLAFSSKTPGRTQMLNFFGLPEEKRLVDLPGYGYASTSKSNQKQWSYLINDYLKYRESLKAVILLMDCRHPLKDQDLQFLNWCSGCSLPVLGLLTKADKLSNNQSKQQLMKTKKSLKQSDLKIELALFSSTKGTGLEEAHYFIGKHLEIGN